MTQGLGSVADLAQAKQRCVTTDWEVGQGQLAEEKIEQTAAFYLLAASAFNPESWQRRLGERLPTQRLSLASPLG